MYYVFIVFTIFPHINLLCLIWKKTEKHRSITNIISTDIITDYNNLEN